MFQWTVAADSSNTVLDITMFLSLHTHIHTHKPDSLGIETLPYALVESSGKLKQELKLLDQEKQQHNIHWCCTAGIRLNLYSEHFGR